MKRVISGVIILVLCLGMMPGAAFADVNDYAADAPAAETTKHICLMDASTGAVLYEKDAYSKAYPASTTKIMTCILALEWCAKNNIDPYKEIVNVGSDFDTHGSKMGFVRREELRFIDLIYGVMLVSGNDAASALAVHIAGSQDQFAVLMNEKAAEIGMKNTHFVKANGLHNENHYSTAYDMALLARYAMRNEEFRKVVSTETWDVPSSKWDSDGYHLENSNRLIHTTDKDKAKGIRSYKYEYATGIKTGDTDQAGRCLVASAEKNGIQLIAVLFGDPQGDASLFLRFENAARYFDWGFTNYATISASELGLETSVNVPVSNGSFEGGGCLAAAADISGKIIAGTRAYIDDLIANKASITGSPAYRDGADELTAPIKAGEEIGSITYYFNGGELFTVPLTALTSVDEIGNVIDPAPSSSPIICGKEDEEEGSPWLFWALIAIALAAVFMIIRLTAARGTKRRRRHRILRQKGRRRRIRFK